MLIQRARDNLVCGRLLQPRRRPGRAGVRRPFAAARPRGHGAGARAAVAESLTVGTVDLQAAVTAGCATRGLARRCAARCPRCAGSGRSSARESRHPPVGGDVAPLLDPEAEVYAALVLGTRDYVEKNGFSHVVIGLSAGSTRRWSRWSRSTRSAPTG